MPARAPVSQTGRVSGISWIDRIIGLVVVAVLVGLVGLGLADNSHAAPTQAREPLSVPPTTLAPGSGTGPGADIGVPTQTTAAAAAPATPTGATTSTLVGAGVPTLPVPGPVTAVGDSIMLDIQPALTADIPGVDVDGVVSRQFGAGIAVVQADRADRTLGNVLVVELGTNGAITPGDVDAMMQAASGVSRVVFVNVCVSRPWEGPDNAVLAAGVARYPGVAVLADWNALATPHPGWFTPDQVHLEPAGATALAALIAQDA